MRSPSGLQKRFGTVPEIRQRVDNGQHFPAQRRESVFHPRGHFLIIVSVRQARRRSSAAGCPVKTFWEIPSRSRCNSLNRHGPRLQIAQDQQLPLPADERHRRCHRARRAVRLWFSCSITPPPISITHFISHVQLQKGAYLFLHAPAVHYSTGKRRTCQSYLWRFNHGKLRENRTSATKARSGASR